MRQTQSLLSKTAWSYMQKLTVCYWRRLAQLHSYPICVSVIFLSSNILESIVSLLEIMQLLTLFSLIKVKDIPEILLGYYETLGVATLEFLPNVFLYVLPDQHNPEHDPENKITDTAKNHPNIFLYIKVVYLFACSLWLLINYV
eukprot:TRINITY_DN277_c0_g2_i1.p4 TRINITY_DN277_c0_g2~~TRINITY_DN277_c0_g2_i1.p4  ORF type:complete len:144 (+),score=2.82 TRINITY_DN277_c0_g2_i1:336-767(+)